MTCRKAHRPRSQVAKKRNKGRQAAAGLVPSSDGGIAVRSSQLSQDACEGLHVAQPEGSPAPGDPDEAADDCVAGGPSGGTGTQAGAADPAVPPLEILSAETKPGEVPWVALNAVTEKLPVAAGGLSPRDVKRLHLVSRDCRNAARVHARFALMNANREEDALGTILLLCPKLKRLEVLVRCGASLTLGLNLPDPDEDGKRLAKLLEKVLVLEAGPSCSSPSFLQQCRELHDVVSFNCLKVSKCAAQHGATVWELCAVLKGNPKLVCSADARMFMGLPDHVDWWGQLSHVRELHLLPSNPFDDDVAALQAAVKLPGLRKLLLLSTSEQAWRAVCNFTQLEELRITCFKGQHYAELYKLRRLTRLRMRVLWPQTSEEHLQFLDFSDGLSSNMPQLTSLQLCNRRTLHGEAEVKRGLDPSLW